MSSNTYSLEGECPSVTYQSKDFEYVFEEINELQEKISNFNHCKAKHLKIHTSFSFNYDENVWIGKLLVEDDV